MAPYSFTKQKRENITTRMNDLLSDMALEEVYVPDNWQHDRR